ncbi:MAG: transposase [Francisellaceae bacterium]|nr:transposase [Francisellaceae bacterium]
MLFSFYMKTVFSIDLTPPIGTSGRGCIPNRVDIKERPAIVETKTRIGDWEGDTIIGANHQGVILSYVDRASKFTILAQLKDKTAAGILSATKERLTPFSRLVKMITYDNGREFASHSLISEHLKAKCYFATPYHSWERGLNEHTNGLVRQYFPKSSNLTLISADELQRVENLLNNRPRKVLGYLKPKEIMSKAMKPAERIALRY